MADYKKMYLALFHATEQAIERLSQLPVPDSEIALHSEVITLLAQGQQQCEDIYTETDD
jgi:hypothetical protein